MRKLTILRPFRCDVLIFDVIGENWIQQCIPPHCTVGYLDVRTHIPIFLTFRFLLKLIHSFLHQDKTGRGYRSFVLLSSLLDQIRPQIIVTCADNNVLVSRFALKNPETSVFFLQNALRDTIGSIPHGIQLPTYLALGQIEAEIFETVGAQCQNYQAVGSVKLGLALEQRDPLDNTTYDLCFISHYRPEFFYENASDLFRKIEEAQRSLFNKLVSYASNNNLSVVVLSKTRESRLQHREFEYFKTIADKVSFEFVRGDKEAREFDTYQAALSSRLIVHLASTLGFEMFSAGMRVLFGASQDKALLTTWGIEHYFDALPEFVKLNSDLWKDFNKSCDHIQTMADVQYQDLTKKSARTIVTMSDDEFPHTSIRKLLSNHLTRNCL